MDSIRCPDSASDRWLLNSALAPHVDSFIKYLTQHGYANYTICRYVRCIAHFARWMTKSRVAITDFNERCVQGFLDDHRLAATARNLYRVGAMTCTPH